MSSKVDQLRELIAGFGGKSHTASKKEDSSRKHKHHSRSRSRSRSRRKKKKKHKKKHKRHDSSTSSSPSSSPRSSYTSRASSDPSASSSLPTPFSSSVFLCSSSSSSSSSSLSSSLSAVASSSSVLSASPSTVPRAKKEIPRSPGRSRDRGSHSGLRRSSTSRSRSRSGSEGSRKRSSRSPSLQKRLTGACKICQATGRCFHRRQTEEYFCPCNACASQDLFVSITTKNTVEFPRGFLLPSKSLHDDLVLLHGYVAPSKAARSARQFLIQRFETMFGESAGPCKLNIVGAAKLGLDTFATELELHCCHQRGNAVSFAESLEDCLRKSKWVHNLRAAYVRVPCIRFVEREFGMAIEISIDSNPTWQKRETLDHAVGLPGFRSLLCILNLICGQLGLNRSSSGGLDSLRIGQALSKFISHHWENVTKLDLGDGLRGFLKWITDPNLTLPDFPRVFELRSFLARVTRTEELARASQRNAKDRLGCWLDVSTLVMVRELNSQLIGSALATQAPNQTFT